MPPPPTILVTMPHHFCVRNILYTKVVEAMAAREGVEWVLLGFNASDEERVRSLGFPNVIFERIRCRVSERRFTQAIQRWFRRVDETYLYNALVYRFLAKERLFALTSRRAMSRAQQSLERQYSNFARSWIGSPAPESDTLYRALSAIRHASTRLQRSVWVDSLFERYRPSLVVHARTHSPHNLAFSTEARRRGIRVAGIVSSWDHPTTKGFVPPGHDALLVGSKAMSDQLCGLHGVPRDEVINTGHAFFDTLHDAGEAESFEIRDQLGVSKDDPLLLLCTNAVTLKAHEPAAARALAREVASNRFGPSAKLIVRTHPQDPDAEREFGGLRGDRVRVLHASAFGYRDNAGAPGATDDGRTIAGLLRAASVVINSRSSITLDAIACDTPVINLGYDAAQPERVADSVRQRYRIEFFEPLVRTGATPLARSEAELLRQIDRYLEDPTLDRLERAAARRDHVEPFDGRAGERIVDTAIRLAGAQAESLLPFVAER
ncbi:MAG: CDP-glycerol glycerophosphotransferase family protein [Planctomycetota bacterium]